MDTNFDRKEWEKILFSKRHKEFLQNLKDTTRLSYFLHDHCCMNGGKPVDALNQVSVKHLYGNPD